jgi:hypothetical protein
MQWSICIWPTSNHQASRTEGDARDWRIARLKVQRAVLRKAQTLWDVMPRRPVLRSVLGLLVLEDGGTASFQNVGVTS